ncbi:hypothetical protein THICB3320734 [Thiomonas sp. CB3]|nr:hypothetical protein THICB3320734 [Thiomonas sp. CB3]
MATDYIPEPGSLSQRLIAWFAINREEELTYRDIAAKFDVSSPNNVLPSLSAPLARDILIRTKSEEGYTVVKPGPNFDDFARCAPASAPAQGDRIKRAISRSTPPPLFDVAQIAIHPGVVRPSAGNGANGGASLGQTLQKLFAVLTPNSHAVLPIAYRTTASDALTRWRKTHSTHAYGITTDKARGVITINRYS